MTDSRRLVDKLWSYCNVLRDDGVGVIEYTEQLTYLLFLKMAHERATRRLNAKQSGWLSSRALSARSSARRRTGFRTRPSSSGSSSISSTSRTGPRPAPTSSGTPTRSCSPREPPTRARAQDSTSRPALIAGIVDAIDPAPNDTVVDPACGTGGFLLVAHEHAARNAENLTPTQRAHLRDVFASGYELVDGTARLAAMNLLLHGIGTPDGDSLIEVRDALITDPGQRWSVVLSNPRAHRPLAQRTLDHDERGPREPMNGPAGRDLGHEAGLPHVPADGSPVADGAGLPGDAG